MNEWKQLGNNIKSLFRTLQNCIIIGVRSRRISELENKIKKLETKLVVERKMYKDYLLETKAIVDKMEKECK